MLNYDFEENVRGKHPFEFPKTIWPYPTNPGFIGLEAQVARLDRVLENYSNEDTLRNFNNWSYVASDHGDLLKGPLDVSSSDPRLKQNHFLRIYRDGHAVGAFGFSAEKSVNIRMEGAESRTD